MRELRYVDSSVLMNKPNINNMQDRDDNVEKRTRWPEHTL